MSDIRVRVELPAEPERPAPIDAAALGAIVGNELRKAQEAYPITEIWVVVSHVGQNLFNLRDPANKKQMKRVPADDPRAYSYLVADDVVVVGFRDRNRGRPRIKGRSVGRSPSLSEVLRGMWDQGQAWAGLDSVGNTPTGLLDMTPGFASDWPSSAGVDTDSDNGILGLVVYSPSGGGRVATWLYQENVGGVASQLRLASWSVGSTSNTKIWDIALPGSDYAVLGSGDVESYLGWRWDFLFYDANSRTLNVVGHGSASRRKQIWAVSEAGKVLVRFASPVSMLQSSYANGKWLKTWIRRGSENYYDQTDSLIRCFARNEGAIRQEWIYDPSALVSGLQCCSHSNPGLTVQSLAELVLNKATGRSPIDPNALSGVGELCVWASGVKGGLTPGSSEIDPYSAVMLSGGPGVVLDGGGFPHPAAPCQASSITAFGAHKTQKASMSALRLDDGTRSYSYDINFDCGEAYVESGSVASWDAYHSENESNPTTGGVASLIEPDLQGFSGTINETYSYYGLADELSLSLSTPGSITFTDIGPSDPFTATWRFDNGYGYNSPWDGTILDCPTCPTPPYSYLLGSHIRLQPLARTTAPEGAVDSDGNAPHDLDLTEIRVLTEMKQLDPLGGVDVVDSARCRWLAYTRATSPVVYGSPNLLAQVTNSIYTYDHYTTEIQVFTDWSTYQIGRVGWDTTTKLVKRTSAGVVTETDIGYKFNSCVVPGAPGDTVTSTREREYAGKIYQIVPLPLAGAVVLIRDKVDALSDAGGMENIPYLVAEVRLYSDPSVIIEAYALNDNSLETPDGEPQRRVYRQYDSENGMLVGNCRGSIETTTGREQIVQIIKCTRQSDSVDFFRATRIYWPYGSGFVYPQVDLIYFDSAAPDFSNPLTNQSWSASAFAGKLVFPGRSKKTDEGYSGWVVPVRDP